MRNEIPPCKAHGFLPSFLNCGHPISAASTLTFPCHRAAKADDPAATTP
jgi:hypothetical protein